MTPSPPKTPTKPLPAVAANLTGKIPLKRPGKPRLKRPHKPSPKPNDRQLGEIAEALPQRAGALARLLFAATDVPVSRTESSVLYALATRPRRVTELADRERITQPGITSLVNRLQERGWVQRESDRQDGRAVLVSLTPAGRQIHEELRAQFRTILHEELVTLGPEDIDALSRTVEILTKLVDKLVEARL